MAKFLINLALNLTLSSLGNAKEDGTTFFIVGDYGVVTNLT